MFSVKDMTEIPDSFKSLFVFKSAAETGLHKICNAFRVERHTYSVSRLMASAADCIERTNARVLATSPVPSASPNTNANYVFSLNDSFTT